MKSTCSAHPNLALIKYWGKSDSQLNIPASPSIGISLEAFRSTTLISTGNYENQKSDEAVGTSAASSGAKISWRVRIDGELYNPLRYADFFADTALHYGGGDIHVEVESSNNFPTAAGLASSAGGFAALAGAVDSALKLNLDQNGISALARRGSGSASRSVYGGFVQLDRGAFHAVQLHDRDFWPQLRCLIVQLRSAAKAISSRTGMETSRKSSPFYKAWIADSLLLAPEARQALAEKNLRALGPMMRRSYLRMFSTMFSCEDPFIYWEADSLLIIKTAEELRRQGVDVYETMDAGPQVKLITTEEFLPRVESALREIDMERSTTPSAVGGGLEFSR